MQESVPTSEAWHKLYAVMAQVKEQAPWEWMLEDEIFGVENPETGEIGFVSIMGTLGEHYSIAVYQGVRALHQFWALHNLDNPMEVAQAIMETAQFQASFEDRNTLEDGDRKLIKELGLKFRGKQAWPMFRNHRPGYVPWFLETAEEVYFLTLALEQMLDVALRSQEDDSLLAVTDEDVYLIRVPQKQGNGLAWHDEKRKIAPSGGVSIPISINSQLLESLHGINKRFKSLEVDLFMMLSPIYEKGGRPYYPYSFLVVESESGFILASEILKPDPTLEDMWGQVPQAFIEALARISALPSQVKVRSFLLESLMNTFSKPLGYKVKRVSRLRMLEEAKESMFSFLGYGEF